MRLLLLLDCLNHILKDSPTVWHIQVDLSCECFGSNGLEAHDLVVNSARAISLNECELHLVNTVHQTLHGPPRELARVISDFLGEHGCSACIQICAPALTLLIPLRKHKQVIVLLFPIGIHRVRVDLASHTHDHVGLQLEQIVFVTHPYHLLVFVLFVRVIKLKLLESFL